MRSLSTHIPGEIDVCEAAAPSHVGEAARRSYDNAVVTISERPASIVVELDRERVTGIADTARKAEPEIGVFLVVHGEQAPLGLAAKHHHALRGAPSLGGGSVSQS